MPPGVWLDYVYAAGLDPDDVRSDDGINKIIRQIYLHGQRDALTGDLEEDV